MSPYRLLLDEMISPSIVDRLWGEGIDALALRDRDLLQATDHTVWNLAQSEERTVVTVNGKDFIRLASREAVHYGIVIIPNGSSRDEQFSYVMNVTNNATARDVFAPTFKFSVVTVSEDMSLEWWDMSCRGREIEIPVYARSRFYH